MKTTTSVSEAALRESDVYVFAATESLPEFRSFWPRKAFTTSLLVPVEGKSSRVGMFVLGMPHFRAYTENEKNFLKAVASRWGLRRRTAKLLQQVMHSRNEWVATFDSHSGLHHRA